MCGIITGKNINSAKIKGNEETVPKETVKVPEKSDTKNETGPDSKKEDTNSVNATQGKAITNRGLVNSTNPALSDANTYGGEGSAAKRYLDKHPEINKIDVPEKKKEEIIKSVANKFLDNMELKKYMDRGQEQIDSFNLTAAISLLYAPFYPAGLLKGATVIDYINKEETKEALKELKNNASKPVTVEELEYMVSIEIKAGKYLKANGIEAPNKLGLKIEENWGFDPCPTTAELIKQYGIARRYTQQLEKIKEKTDTVKE